MKGGRREGGREGDAFCPVLPPAPFALTLMTFGKTTFCALMVSEKLFWDRKWLINCEKRCEPVMICYLCMTFAVWLWLLRLY